MWNSPEMGDWSQFIARWKMGISWLSKPLELGVLFWCHPCHTLQNLDQKWRLRIRIQGWQWSFRYPDQSWKPDLGWSMYIDHEATDYPPGGRKLFNCWGILWMSWVPNSGRYHQGEPHANSPEIYPLWEHSKNRRLNGKTCINGRFSSKQSLTTRG